MTVLQVAERLSVSTDSIYRWKRQGDFPMAIKLGAGTARWRLADVEAWEQTRQTCFATALVSFD
tara:strand:+ start:230 stop:421 length:192 start_codon:yes stop_codon:yes gene_type:complete